MPKALEAKLKKEYGNDKHAIYGTLEKIKKAKSKALKNKSK